MNYDANEYTLEKANAVVGCEANREMEREISAAAVTVIKNENSVLPLKLTKNSKVLMLVPYDNERAQMIMAWNRAKQEGLIPDGAEVDFYRFNSATISEDLKAKLDWADTYIINSEISSTSRMEGKHWLSAAPYAFCDYAEENGKIAIISSVDKPYDVQSYPKADAIVAAYGCKGASVDPTEALKDGLTGSEATYGPNIIAAVEVILGTYGAQGKLPLDIPVYDVTDNRYLNEISYERGYGLTYDAKEYELFVYDDSLSGSAKDIYIKDGQYLGSNATAPSNTKPASGGYAYYKDGVLELNGYDNEKAHFIFEELALELYLVGDNTIGAIYDSEFADGYTTLEARQGNLVIDAADGGKLTIASNPLDAYANIQVKDLYFNGGELTSCLANGTYGAAVQLNGGNLYLENGYVAYVSDTNDFASATKWDGTTDISDYDCVWIVTEKEDTGALIGDVNGDGLVNAKDALLLRKSIAAGNASSLDLKVADVNGDGVINAKDVVKLRRKVTGGYN